MVAKFCVGISELLAFSAMVLAILVNMGQISQNIVARNIYYAELDLTGLGGGGALPATVFAGDQAAPSLQNQGLKETYQWGLYNFCGGAGNTRSCGPRGFGDGRFEPLQVLYADINQQYQTQLNQTVSEGTFADSDYLGRFSHAAFWLIFIGTVLAGLTFLLGFLAHRFAFLVAALVALLGAAALGAGAAIFTAILVKARDSIADVAGAQLHLTNALWMMWAAFGALTLSIVPFIISCCTGRSEKY